MSVPRKGLVRNALFLNRASEHRSPPSSSIRSAAGPGGGRVDEFVRDLPFYQTALEAAGFEVSHVRDRGEFAEEFFAGPKAKAAQLDGPPPLGLHLILGADASSKLANMIAAVDAGVLAPVEIICHKPSA